MIDIVDIKKELRNKNLKVVETKDYIYLENWAGERIVLLQKGSKE